VYCCLIRADDLHYGYLYLGVLGSSFIISETGCLGSSLLVLNFARVGGASIGNGSVFGSLLSVNQRVTLSSTTLQGAFLLGREFLSFVLHHLAPV
jgi:hypothetical protein